MFLPATPGSLGLEFHFVGLARVHLRSKGWEPSLTPFHPHHEPPFIRRMDIEGKTPTKMPSWVLPDRLVSYTADDPSTTLDGRSLQMRRYYLSHDAVRNSLPY